MLICDRDAKWSETVRVRLQDGGLRVIRTPYRAPNANAYAERFVRSIKHERRSYCRARQDGSRAAFWLAVALAECRPATIGLNERWWSGSA